MHTQTHHKHTLAQQSGTVVGGRIPFETCGVERLVCERACMRDVLHAATLEDELCPFLHAHSLLLRQKQD